MKRSVNTLKNQTKNPVVEKELKGVYSDGFNIYAAINKLKKTMNRSDFPDDVIVGVCRSYWRSKPGIKGRWPWFLAAMEYQTRLWICDQHEASKPDPRAPMAQSIKQILKGI